LHSTANSLKTTTQRHCITEISQNPCFSWKNNLFSRQKQFVFSAKTTCFQQENNLFSAEKQLVFSAKTKKTDDQLTVVIM